MIRSAWVTMGIPFDVPMVNEKKEGVIDLEALFMATFLFMEQDRMVTDLPAWLIRFRDIINHQKLKSMFRSCPEKHKRAIFKKLNHDPFGATPESFKRVFGLKNIPTKESVQTIERRSLKLNSLNNVAQTSVMIKNRLLYGTGFRAAGCSRLCQLMIHMVVATAMATVIEPLKSTAPSFPTKAPIPAWRALIRSFSVK